ncbi:MAG TPA: glycerophosphodiester phosphodiesterase [Gaiellaceae bacterium]
MIFGRDRPLVIGHRGAPVRAPENTFESFEAAIDLGADAIELDVVAGLVIAHSKRERPARPLALDDALQLVRARGVSVLIDLKCAHVERDVAEAVRRHGLLDQAFVSSTSPWWLRRVAAAEPALLRSISYPNDRYRVSRFAWPAAAGDVAAAAGRALMPARVGLLLRLARAGALTLHHRVISEAVVEAARERDAAVVAWTVNDPAAVVRLGRLGVDGIVTDDPEMALSALATLESL